VGDNINLVVLGIHKSIERGVTLWTLRIETENQSRCAPGRLGVQRWRGINAPTPSGPAPTKAGQGASPYEQR
jgi:hypothetical protein